MTFDIALPDPLIVAFTKAFHPEYAPETKKRTEKETLADVISQPVEQPNPDGERFDSGLIEDLNRITIHFLKDWDAVYYSEMPDSIRGRNKHDEFVDDFLNRRVGQYSFEIKSLIDNLIVRDNWSPLLFKNYLILKKLIDSSKGEEAARRLRELVMIARSAIPRSVTYDESRTVIPDLHKPVKL